MSGFISRNSLFLSSVALMVVSFQLMSSSIRNPELPGAGAKLVNSLVSPVQKFHRESVGGIDGVWSKYVWLQGVQEKQSDLESQIRILQEKNSALIEFEHENRRLRSLLGFTERLGKVGIPANVIARDPSNWLKTISVDKGESDGVTRGMPLVDGHALVGLTTAVSGGSSKVQLLTDPNSAIDALVQSSRAPGVVEGNGSDLLIMRYVEKDEDVKIGDRIIASGLDMVYPKGTLIGVVTAVDTQTNSLFHQVEVKPGVNLNYLESVLVVESVGEESVEVLDLKGRASEVREGVAKGESEVTE